MSSAEHADVEPQRSRVPNRWGEGQRLRQEILDAAARLLDEAGSPDEISLRAIARGAGVTAPAIYKHFRDKAELMWTLLDDVYASLAEIIRSAQRSAPASDPWVGLRTSVDAYCRFATDEPRRYDLLFRIAPSLPPSTELAHHPMHQVLEAWRAAVTPYLTVAVGADAARCDQVAKLLWTSLHGQLALWWNLSGVPVSELEELRDSLLREFFGRC
ncbi:TetR/AcrR family transcriptional regulator [Streptomyces sp. NPDC096311]|uniref:TetR/AcrR family transcriptional regulator n=1 Tax=Streptomyces sp. NPDC096311 TaxID=3366083 RepID=UPI00382E72C5